MNLTYYGAVCVYRTEERIGSRLDLIAGNEYCHECNSYRSMQTAARTEYGCLNSGR
jgi:hypothetical protein